MTLEQDTTTDDLTAEEREILEFMLRNKRQGKSIEAKIEACDHSKDTVLSFGQQRSWMQHELNKGQSSPYDTLCLNLRLRGKLNTDAMHRSLAEIVRRHEILRTTFELRDAGPVQVVGEVDPVFEYEDLSNLADAERESYLAELLLKTRNTLFNLAQDPLFQTRLIRLAEADHVLCLTMHHIIFDEWSKGILLRELGLLYPAFDEGRQSPLPQLPIQYRDFSVWQRDWLQGEVLQEHLDYWTQKLAGLSTLALPTDYPRPQQQTFNGAYETMTLSRELSDALNALSKQHGVTLYITMLSVLGILLHRYCGQDDISIGTVITNRDRDELHDLIGFFLNTLVMRLDLSGEPPYPEFIERVKETAMGAFAHQHLPFERLVAELHPERETNRNPLFQVSLTMLDAPDTSSLRIKDLELAPISGMGLDSLFDLDVLVNESPAGLVLRFAYNTDLFAAATVQRMLRHYKELLQAVVTDASRPVTRLPMLTRSEYTQIIIGWNQTRTDYVNNETLISLFDRQVRRSPQAVAVRFEKEQLSYAELEQKADRLAHLLVARGIEPGQFVGVYLERSIDLVVALLGVLKTGAAYVPLDPDYPQQRNDFMISDANIRVLLAQESLASRLPSAQADTIYVDNFEFDETVAAQSLPTVTEEMLAYVIYTSGSTGEPKGVMVAHKAVVNHACWISDLFEIDQGDRILQNAPISFDASVGDIFPALLNGASIVLPVPGGHRDVEYLLRTIRQQEVTMLTLVPVALRMLLQGLDDPADLASLKRVGCGGEAVTPELQREFYKCCSAPLYNLYGPTETTIDATSFLCEAEFTGDNIPIGTPVSNSCAYILDPNLQPVPIGVQGELHIGGKNLAQGYLNRPELTAEKFIANPFSDDSTARLYKTGDLARYRADGNIEFVGRVDMQVKIHGFRIELDEIESILLSHPAVREAVVILREDIPDDKRLVAYVVIDREEAEGLSVTDLRTHARSRLPEYMLPAVVVILDSLPLSANDKLDRSALPKPDTERQLDQALVRPSSNLERQLVEIWQEVLGIEQVGIHDNFFDLGGHSLMATQVVSRIRGQLNAELPLSAMFGYPTVTELAPVVQSLLDEMGEEQADIIPVADREGKLPLSFAQERLWFLGQLEPDSTAYNMPLALRMKGELSVAALENSLNAIVSRQKGLRTHFTLYQGKPFQIIEDMTIELKQDDLSMLTSEMLEDEVKARIDAEALQPFDLNTGPLLRCSLLRLSDHEHVLLLTMHHVISDGWSLGILFRELGACYEAFSRGEQPALAELPVQYADFAVWQREWLSGEVLASQMAYWREKLEDLSTLNLPTDFPRPAVQTYTGSSEKMTLDAELSKRLKTLSRQASVTLFMTLLGGFSVLMHRYSGQEDIVLGSPIANRNRSELEDLIGFFVNSLVIRTDISGNPSFRELVQRVNRTALDAYEHQDLPFEKLVDEIQPERDLSHNPLFQVMFSLQNAPVDSLGLKGLTIESVSRKVKVSVFDLECHVLERGDGLGVVFVYNTDLFDASTIRRMLEHYRNLLQSIAAQPDRHISELPMLSQHEQQQLIDWNQTAIDYPRDKTVLELFEQQVARTPDSIAVVFAGKSLSYDQLNKRANKLAHHLRARGVGPEVMVGIYMERCLEMVIGLTGILKAGGAYVPLDLDYPALRIAFMLKDAQLPVLLTMSSLKEKLPSFEGEQVCLDTDWAAIENESKVNPDVEVSADNLAYVIYTSGSTGTPKGVQVQHGGLMNLVSWHRRVYDVGPTDRATHLAGLGFDASVWELWPYLASGASLYLVSDERRLAPAGLWSWMAEQGITLSFLPTQLAEAALREPIPEDLKLRVLLTGGDRLHGGLVKKPVPFRLVNHYGPTENSVVTTCTDIDVCSPETPAIGRPIDNVQVYILDKGLQPVPVGVWGELYIGGESLARDYLNQPKLTAEKFIPNPFSDDPQAHIYATGDNVRYRSDGNIEFLGRIDNQVKIRGFRIELGEIEAVLSQHDNIGDCAVLIYEDLQGNKNIAAYFVSDSSFSTLSLRNYLRKKLPNNMIPTLLTKLDEIPVTPNGKTDYKTLASYTEGKTIRDSVYHSPETPAEKKIASIWDALLNVDRIGVGDNFFDIGGHSLLIIQAKSAIEKELGVSVPVMDFFHQTLGQIASYCEKNQPPEMSVEEV
jgi:amino acid adenylation domain-containing protein